MGQDHVADAAVPVHGGRRDGEGGSWRDGEILTVGVLGGRFGREGDDGKDDGMEGGGIGRSLGVHAAEDGAGAVEEQGEDVAGWRVDGVMSS